MARPSVIDRILRYREGGEPVTVFDHIVNALRAGAYFEQACASAGIHKDTAYGWRKTAARLRLANLGEDPDPKTITANERRYLAFSDAVEEAESSWEISALALLEQLGRGYETTRTVKKQDAQGNVLETTTTTETLVPNAQVLEWRLTRRFPARYGQRVEVTGADGGAILLSMEERADALSETLEAYLKGHADAAVPKRRRRKAPANGSDPTSSA